jgi:nitroreductase
MNIFTSLSQIIKNRRSIFPSTYSSRPIDDELILKILENANWAPTHKKTEPWRYKVLKGESLVDLGKFLSNIYKENTNPDNFSEIKLNKLQNNPPKAACIIAICMQRDKNESVPEWEELAAVACSVQNMWLSCTALGIGAYWSTPKEALQADKFLKLKEGEKCLGLFYMGYPIINWPASERGDISSKIEWI